MWGWRKPEGCVGVSTRCQFLSIHLALLTPGQWVDKAENKHIIWKHSIILIIFYHYSYLLFFLLIVVLLSNYISTKKSAEQYKKIEQLVELTD